MLGLARHSQLAGWGLVKPEFISQTTATTAMTPSWAGSTSVTVNQWLSPYNGDNLPGTSFDSTGIVSGNRAVYAMTYRMKTASNYTFQSDGFSTGYEFVKIDSGLTQYTPFYVYLNDSTQSFIPVINPKLARHTASGDMAFLIDWGSYGVIRINGVTWDSLADRWITVIVGASTTQGDFANHNPVETFGALYGRITIVDAETEELIVVRDFRTNQFNYLITDAADRTWRYRSAAGDSATAWIYSEIRNADLFESDDILVAAGWVAVNQTIDPTATTDGRPAWQWLLGQRMPETVAGVRAWINFSSRAVADYDSTNDSLTELMPCRVSTTGNIFSIMNDDFLATPTTSSLRP